MNESIISRLLSMLDSNQFGAVAVMRVLNEIDESNVNEVFQEWKESGRFRELMQALAKLSLLPPVFPFDVNNPLALTEDQKEYANPGLANEFLSLAYGTAVAELKGVDTPLPTIEAPFEFAPESETETETETKNKTKKSK